MSSESVPTAHDENDPFDWLRPFMSGPADLSLPVGNSAPHAPPSRDLSLRRAQEAELLDEQIWLLAMSEAYAADNEALLRHMMDQTKAEVAADFLRRHPPFGRFVKEHIDAGTCGRAVQILIDERERRKSPHQIEVILDEPEPSSARGLLPEQSAAEAPDNSEHSHIKSPYTHVMGIGHIASLKKAGRFSEQRPTWNEVQKILSPIFVRVTKREAQAVVKKIWEAEAHKRGPRPRRGIKPSDN
ncbi:MAG TPA: hypothetical protein VNC39_00665 [Acidocella sp.]|jgi:hypothetical protein|uniref:hypothetical protein n=1 Tax=Acidocella sp. TaxID=50710 RepID=UPI002CDA6B4A|nr:hypothetical protein [Acidocella sp.]HVE20462.1 hypothetical protein [Acidocella sp.]